MLIEKPFSNNLVGTLFSCFKFTDYICQMNVTSTEENKYVRRVNAFPSTGWEFHISFVIFFFRSLGLPNCKGSRGGRIDR